jgi:hypothetical protein
MAKTVISKNVLVESGVAVLMLTIVFSGVIYNRNLVAVPDQSYLHVFLWLFLAWLPWAGIIPFSRQHLDQGNRDLWHWSVASFLTAFVCTMWLIVVSNFFSPYLGQPLTMFGLYKWWLIFWFALSLLLFWANLGFHLLKSTAGQLPVTSNEDERRLAIWQSGGQAIVNKEDIVCIKSKDYYAQISLQCGQTYWVRTRLNQLQEELSGKLFVRVHRSAIVNLNYLRNVDRNEDNYWEAVMVDDTRIRLSRAGKAKLQEALSPIK